MEALQIECGRLRIEGEITVRELLTSKLGNPQDLKFVLCSAWWNKWCDYTNFDENLVIEKVE